MRDSDPDPAVAERIAPLLASARALAAAGRMAEAEPVYRQVLENSPDAVEAMTFLASCALRRGDPAGAVALLQRAREQQPGNPQLLKNLGVACEAAGDLAAARAALEAALQAAPEHFGARLHLGALHERMGQAREALVQYFRAVTTAQTAGQWLNAETTPSWLHAKVRHAMDAIDSGRSRLFNDSLQPLRARYGASELKRVQQWLDCYLQRQLPVPADVRQRPKFMYFPGLVSQPYYPNKAFPFIQALEAATAAVRDELQGCLQTGTGLEPFLGEVGPDQAGDYLGGGDAGPPAWDAFFFYRHGHAYRDNAERCPFTDRLLETLPLVRIREHAPEVCFSILTPGTHILPHHGVTNTRLVLHLPLLVPDNCALVVGGEQHAWREGECVVFDDTYLHEAWNRGDGLRAVLIMDVWNPGLTEVEQAAITALVGDLGDFNRACER